MNFRTAKQSSIHTYINMKVHEIIIYKKDMHACKNDHE
jgi:hypothetical protein